MEKEQVLRIFKGKGSVLECKNYIVIKLMSHTMKVWERMIEARLREITKIVESNLDSDQENQLHNLYLH